MKRFVVLFVLGLMVLSACSNLPVVGAMFATETPTPSSTPVPTNTPLPTETPTPVPTATFTATPDITATAAVKATEAASSIQEEIKKALQEKDADIPYENGYLAWKQEQPVSIDLNEPGNKYLEFSKGLTAANFILKSDVTWTADYLVICGLMFRSEASFETGKQYQFVYLRFSGAPAWDIEFHNFGRYQNIITGDVRYSDALDLDNGATNQFMLVAQDEKFIVYINGVRQGQFFDYSKQMHNGKLAFMAGEDAGKSSCKFENSWLWVLNK